MNKIFEQCIVDGDLTPELLKRKQELDSSMEAELAEIDAGRGQMWVPKERQYSDIRQKYEDIWEQELTDAGYFVRPVFENWYDELTRINEWVDTNGARVSVSSSGSTYQVTKSQATSPMTVDQLAPTLGMYDTNVSLNFGNKLIKIPFSKEKMAYGASFTHKNIFTKATSSVIKEIYDKTGIKLSKAYSDIIIWTYNKNNNIILVHIPGFNFIIDKNDFIKQLGGTASSSTSSTGPTVLSSLKALETNDFQNRNGNYPRSGVPDTIDVSDYEISFSFKNTSQREAENWVRDYLSQNGFSVFSNAVGSYQSGDYDDDWVDVTVKIEDIRFAR